MAYEEKYKKTELPHSLSLQDRRKLTVSGVEDVESFDENAVVLQTCGGLLILGAARCTSISCALRAENCW